MSKRLLYTFFILLAAIIWGFAFVVQSTGIADVGPFLFSGARMLVACVILIPLYLVTEHRKRRDEPLSEEQQREERQRFWLAAGVGGSFGVLTTIGNAMQLTALLHMTAGKNAFLVCMYVAIVPFILLAVGQKSTWLVWLGVVLAVIGMFLLCIKGDSLAFAWADWLAIGSAVFAAVIIAITDKVVNRVNALVLVLGECVVCGVLSTVVGIFRESIAWEDLLAAGPEILYLGILGTALAFTLQAVGQREVDPAVTSILISLESVFAVIFGFLFLHEMLTGRELLGCAFVFAATIISNLPQAAPKEAVPKEAAAE